MLFCKRMQKSILISMHCGSRAILARRLFFLSFLGTWTKKKEQLLCVTFYRDCSCIRRGPVKESRETEGDRVFRALPLPQALRRIMEQFSDTTRFALACNSSASVIEPLQSRCAILRFRKLDDSQLVRRLRQVCAMEALQVTDDGIEAIVFCADGDMRSALNNLQSTVSAFGVVNRENVEKVRLRTESSWRLVTIPSNLVGRCVHISM
ncbi:putative replication factor C subunit 4, partial [Toxoplasma gondii FOU]